MANPIRKHRFPKVDGISGVMVAFFSGWGPWVATCPDCNERLRGASSRKVARDHLHAHRKLHKSGLVDMV